jgi:signal transduction histidine kinase
MKNMANGLPQRYVAALRKHLNEGPSASLLPALGLGRRAVMLGLATLDLARIHEQAAATLGLPSGKSGYAKQAEIFFAEAIVPIVQTHQAARRSEVDLHQLNETLNRRTLELSDANRRLQRGIVRRKTAEAALKQNSVRYGRLLKESVKFQEELRQLTRRLMVSQEDERRKISLELQDEIAQNLLGINVRLVSLKQKARKNTRGLKKEIASTQRLVVKSAKSVRRFAHELEIRRHA